MFLALSVSLVLSASFQAPKKPLDHSVYDGWNSIRGAQLSADGAWFTYGVYPQEGDGTLYVIQTSAPSTAKYTIARGTTAHFTHDNKFLIISQAPLFAEAKKARIAKAKPEDQPKTSLIVINLASGQRFDKERVTALKYAEEDQDWLLYKHEPLAPAKAPSKSATPERASAQSEINDSEDNGPADLGLDADSQRRTAGAQGRATAIPVADPSSVKPGDSWTLRNLATGKEEVLTEVSDAAFNKKGSELAYVTASKDAKKDGVTVRNLTTGKSQSVISGEGHYKNLALSEDGKLVAFVSDKDTIKAKPPLFALYQAETSESQSTLKAKLGSQGLPADWCPADATLSFSPDNRRLFFQSAPKPEEEKKSEVADEDKAVLDIWNWRDDRLQTEQLVELSADKSRSYLAYVETSGDRIVQLATPLLRDVSVPDKGKASSAVVSTDVPYLREASWAIGFSDLYRLDVRTGQSKKIVNHRQFDLSTSPDGRWALEYDLASKSLVSIELSSGKIDKLALPSVSFVDELDDHPDLAPMYGMAGFTTDGRALLYDRYDIWAIDPSGAKSPENLTHGTGRRRHLEFRSLAVNVNQETNLVDLSKPNLLSARNDDNESTGVFELSQGQLKEIVYGEHGYTGILKAKDAPVFAYAESTFSQFPDYWLCNASFSNASRVSDANPQQAQYRWGSVELVNWMGNDGQQLKGLLYTPEGLDRTKKYPMIAYFYERNSQTLYNYIPPVPSASIINIPYFVSNGYCVFVPDIDYRVGYPGPSAYSAIISGVQAMLLKGFIDSQRLGIQGQSWGGYQTAYLITQTHMFAAAGAGAPVGDMFSAYGGIRYGTGIVRQFQYEHSQSRIGGTPWQRPLQYLENSPVFAADRVKTPVLIMSNDKDGAVPHTQGIEFFVDLRRLNKPSWLLVYNDEDHNLTMRKNRKDLSVRLAQFFDHYLKGAPMPIWMSKGVPAIQKGKTYGFELDK